VWGGRGSKDKASLLKTVQSGIEAKPLFHEPQLLPRALHSFTVVSHSKVFDGTPVESLEEEDEL